MLQISTGEYKSKHDWVGKVVHWEMFRKFQFDHTNKWYMHNPENETHNSHSSEKPSVNTDVKNSKGVDNNNNNNNNNNDNNNNIHRRTAICSNNNKYI